MTSPLRILLLEDNTHDAELIGELLQAELACEITRVQTRDEFIAGLEDPALGLILADYKLPTFDGLSALQLALASRADVPFIFVSGSLGEEVAIEAVKIGATDYVVKSRLSRLVPSVQRALREGWERIERKKAEEALRRGEAYLAQAQALSHTGSFGWDPVREQIIWSDETYRIFECEPAVPPTIDMVLERTHPEDRERLREVLRDAISERSEFVVEHRLVMPGGSVKHVSVVAKLFADEDDSGFTFVGALMDVTERKRAEAERERLRQVEADLAYMNRVSMMGELAASLAHEIKQPIAAGSLHARACTQWLAREVPDLEQASKAASAMVATMMRAGEIIDRVNSLYRRGTPEREVADLNDIVREMSLLLGETAKRCDVFIHTELDPDLPVATVDRVQLQQVLMNLMLNAIEAMQETGGALTIASKMTGDDLLIVVSDTGVGLPAGIGERIFDAYFSTKPNSTGMGLSICKRIVAAHGGELTAGPNKERGAIFQFILPIETIEPSRTLL